MLQKERLEKVLAFLRPQNIRQMLVSDPVAIFYLTGKWVDPGERFYGLLLREGKETIMILNSLFRFSEELGVQKHYYADGDNITEILRPYVAKDEILGVDKQLPARFLLPLMEAKIAKNYCETSYALDYVRSCKDAWEQEKMRISSHVNDLAMAEFKKLIKPGVHEEEVAAQTLAIYKRLGASRFSFEPIVAFGKNAADPHHMPDDTLLQEGDTVLFDIGCVVDDYCSDMTRVFYYKKEPSAEAKRIYQLVRSANEAAEAMLKPGIRISSIDKTARDIITAGGYGQDFTHRLGHFIGLETHEAGDVSAANQNLTQVGNIFSIEPGIYHRETGIGVRIEDLVLITEDGAEILNHYTHDWEVID